MTRETGPERVKQAFLRFKEEGETEIKAVSPLGVTYDIPKSSLTPSLRTPVGIDTFDISAKFDYIAKKKYPEILRVCRAAGVKFQNELWDSLPKKVESAQGNLMVCCRINPFSPSQNLIAFFSSEEMAPSDQVNLIMEPDPQKAKALCVTINSIVFLSQFFSSKEESTGRFVHIRVYDLQQAFLVPLTEFVKPLNLVFEEFADSKFLSLRQQFDRNFDKRYEEFWEKQRGNNQRESFAVLDKPVEPADVRVELDLAVCNAIGLDMTKKDLIELYEIIVREMIIIKGLKRD
jgi:hypothetical protein